MYPSVYLCVSLWSQEKRLQGRRELRCRTGHDDDGVSTNMTPNRAILICQQWATAGPLTPDLLSLTCGGRGVSTRRA